MWIFHLMNLARGGRVSPWHRRIFGSVRVCAYLGCVAAGMTALFARHALGRMHEEAEVLGRELRPLADLLEGVTPLRINGERLSISSSTVQGTTVGAVLDRFERQCQENPGPLALHLNRIAEKVPAALPGAEEVRALLGRVALSRDERAEGGSVLCFTGSPNMPSEDDPAARFGSTGDLGAFGNLRYVTVSRGEGSESDGVTVMALLTEGSFKLGSLEPPVHGDTPGSDSAVIPRPPGSVRLFTAEVEGSPYSVRIYETSAPPASALAFYDEAMKDSSAPIGSGIDPVRGYIKDGKPVLVNVDTDASKTLVTLSEVGVYADAIVPRVRK